MAYLKGLDVSQWQSPASWNPTGYDFIIVRAAYGLTEDPRYDAHVAKARAAGLWVGAYLFSYNFIDPIKQADFLMSVTPKADGLFLDVEGAASLSQAQTQAFFDHVHAHGLKAGLYMSGSTFILNGHQDANWIAQWGSTTPTKPWIIWQYTESGAGVGGVHLDLDYFNGTVSDLRSFLSTTLKTVPAEDIMRTFTVTGPSTGIQVRGTGHAAPTLDGGTSASWPRLTDAQTFANALPIKLAVAIPGGLAGEDRTTAFLVSVGAVPCCILAKDVVAAPPPTSTATAVAAERTRIANAIAAKIAAL